MPKFLTSLSSFFLNFSSGYRQVKSVERWCDTGQAIDDWTAANTIPISSSETGRMLVKKYIEAYLEFTRRNRYFEIDVDYIKMWCEHLQPPPLHTTS